MSTDGPPQQPPVVRVSGLSRAFPGVQALDRVDFELRRGEVHVLVGENGAGKSTLVKVLSGVYQPEAGSIEIDGRPVRLDDPHQARLRGIATIYQEPTLAPTLTVAENLFLGREPRLAGVFGLVDRRGVLGRAQAFLDELGFPLRAHALVRTLSVAECQLVEIARALAMDVRVLIMDEPTAALTEHEVDRLFAIIADLRARGVAILYISHRLSEVARVGDRVTVFRDGRHVATLPATTNVATLIRLMVGRDLSDVFPDPAARRGEVVLQAEALSRPGVFHDVSLEVHAGEIVGIAGLVGCGRSEVVRAIAGVERASAGDVRVHGRRLEPGQPSDALRHGLTFLPADRRREGLLLTRSILENISVASLPRFSSLGLLDKRAERAVATRYAQELRVQTPSLRRRVQVLSGGNQQKTLLGRALCRGAQCFVFDEPTRGIDVGARVEIYHLLNRLARDGAAVLISSSDLPELLGLCDRIVVMAQGRVTAVLQRAEASEERVMAAAFAEPAIGAGLAT